MCADFNLLETRTVVLACYLDAMGKGLEETPAKSMASKLMSVRHPYLGSEEVEDYVTKWLGELLRRA